MVLAGASIHAQRNYSMTITEPAGVAGVYSVVPGGFGTQDYCNDAPLTAEWVIGTNANGTEGCEALDNDLTGKIALIDRGSCNFSLKCLNAQNAGAIATVICNNVTDPSFAMGAGDFADQVMIPCFMMDKAECDVIRVEAPVEITLAPSYTQDVISTPIIWGANEGEGDFSGGLNGWTTNSVTCAGVAVVDYDLWEYDEDGFDDRGAWGASATNSVSACNGAMVFNSDFHTTAGEQNGTGGGCQALQVGELISPVVDLSGSTAPGVILEYWEHTRQFQSMYYVAWSPDAGATWDTVQINTELEVNTGTLNGYTRIPMPSLVGSTQAQVKFIYEADFYFWMIDDVRFVEQEANNMRVNDFVMVAPNAMNPAWNSMDIQFGGDVENIGAEEQTNVNLNMSIQDPNGDFIFSEDADLGNVAPNTLIDNTIYNSYATGQMGTAGMHTATYTISADQDDFDTSNDTQSSDFMLTENTFAKELGYGRDIFPADGNWDVGEAHSWAYGNYYAVGDNADLFQAESCSFIVTNAADVAGRNLNIILYSWTDDNADLMADPTERTIKAFAAYTITGSEPADDFVEAALSDFSTGQPYRLENNTQYIMTVEYVTTDEVNFGMGASEAIDYTANVFLTSDATAGNGTNQFNAFLGVNGDLSVEPYSSAGFGNDVTPAIRLNTGAWESSTVEVLNNVNVNVYPNPVVDVLVADVAFTEANDVTFNITDLTGRVLMTKEFNNFTAQNVSFDTNALAGGAYFLTVQTEAGVKTTRFVVAK